MIVLLALLNESDAYFHKDNRWQEKVMAALASGMRRWPME